MKESLKVLGKSVFEWSQILGISEVSVYRKLKGETPFTFNEFMEIVKASGKEEKEVIKELERIIKNGD